MPATIETAGRVVTANLQNQVLCTVAAAFFAQQATIGLIDPMTSGTEVADGLAQVGRQILLPGFPVVDLIAMRKTVAVSVDARFAIRIHEGFPSAIGLDFDHHAAAINARSPFPLSLRHGYRRQLLVVLLDIAEHRIP